MIKTKDKTEPRERENHNSPKSRLQHGEETESGSHTNEGFDSDLDIGYKVSPVFSSISRLSILYS